MRQVSMSVSHGDPAGDIHNFRKRDDIRNVDPERSQFNDYLIERSKGSIYEDLFSEALEKYNAKQTRSDRIIDDYLKHIESGNQEKAVYEMVVQIGKRETNSAETEGNRITSAMVYRKWLGRFEREFPQFKIMEAAIHQDEATPHMHVAYVPFSTGNKRGLETKNSLSGAVKQMGYEDIRDLNKRLFTILEEVAAEHGIDRLDVGIERGRLDVRSYKEWAAELETGDYAYEVDPRVIEMISELAEVVEKQDVLIQDLVACEPSRLGAFAALNDLRQQAIELSRELNPIKQAVQGILSRCRAFVDEISLNYREYILNPVTERLRALREQGSISFADANRRAKSPSVEPDQPVEDDEPMSLSSAVKEVRAAKRENDPWIQQQRNDFER